MPASAPPCLHRSGTPPPANPAHTLAHEHAAIAHEAAADPKFTPDESRCISLKVQKLLKEGRERDQAVAVAIKTCAPSKATTKAAANANDDTPSLPRLPTEHRAEKNADGTWNIFDVPVYADETIRAPDTDEKTGGFKSDKDGRVVMRDYRIDRAWLEGAVAMAASRRLGGYFPPLHVNHHGCAETKHAGIFVLRRVADYAFEGKRRAILFADLIRVPEDSYAELKAGRLPYRSVEILDIRRSAEKAEVDSIALMADTVPRFRFPNLRVAEEQRLDAAAHPAVAHYAAADGSVAIVSFFQEEQMATPATGAAPAPAATAAMADEMDKVKAAMAKAAEAVRAKLEKIGAALDKVLEAFGEEKAEEETEDKGDTGPAEPTEPAMSAEKPSPAAIQAAAEEARRATAASKSDTEKAGLVARVAALETQLATQARDREVATAVKATADALEAEGFVIERTKLELIARNFGPKGLESFASLLRETPTPGPRDGWDLDLARNTRRTGEDEPEVASYASGGPDQLQAARHLAALYTSADSKFIRDAGYNLKTYLATNMGAPVNGTAAATK